MKIYIQARFAYDNSLESFYRKGFNEMLGHECVKYPAEADISIVFKYLYSPRSLTEKKILIFPDNTKRYPHYFDSISEYFDHIFLCHSEPIVDEEENIHHLPFAYRPEVHYPAPTVDEKDIDCLFVGTRCPSREFLKDIPNIRIYGDGWPRGRVSIQKWRELHSRAKIVVNSHRPNDTENMRQYEVLGGTENFLLTDREYCGKDKEHFVLYEDKEDLKEKIRYYLNHPKERKKIAERGYKNVVGETYSKRCEQILNTIGGDRVG